MNNRHGRHNFEEGMSMFNNLMGNLSHAMSNMGNSNAQDMTRMGQQLGNLGQQMGAWGQSMANAMPQNNLGNQTNHQYNSNIFDSMWDVNGDTLRHFQNLSNTNRNQNPNNQYQYQYSSNGPNTNTNINTQRQWDNVSNNEHRQHQRPYNNNRYYPSQNVNRTFRPSRRVRTEHMTPEKRLFLEAKTYIQKEEFENAIDNILYILEINPEPRYSQLLAFCYLKKREFDTAASLLRDLVTKHPNNSKLQRYLGIAIIEKTKVSSSLDLINEAVGHFHHAYEISNNETNKRNYLNARKLRFLAMNEFDHIRKTGFFESVQKYGIENIEKYLKKNYLESPQRVPDHFKCAITLVS